MLLVSLSIIAGFILLVAGADRFVLGSGATARNLGVPPILIGLTIVGFATSAPEIVVSVSAALQGLPGLAVGNAVGSNIANIGLVLGVAVLVRPIWISQSVTLRGQMPLLLVAPILPAIFFYFHGELTRGDGVVLLIGLGAFICWMAWLGFRATRSDPMVEEFEAEIRADMRTPMAVLWLVIGLATLMLGSHLLVWGAENMARALGITDLLIGVTLVAIGTSLPELAVSVTCAYKGETELALGNIIGSNIFNLLAVLGIAAVIHPITPGPDVLWLHFPVMLAFTVAMFFMAYNYRGASRIRRPEGLVLLLAFMVYHGYLASQSF